MTTELPRPFGPYRLLEKLGAGGMGAAYLAVPGDGERILLVVKRLHERFASDATVSARLRHEAAVAVSVDSPHVVRVLDVGVIGGEPFIAMEHVPGSTIARLLASITERGEQLAIGTAVALVLDVLTGLEALHEAVHPDTREPLVAVHRDVSPRNIIVTPEARAVVIDLGLGKSNLRDWATQTGALLGTPGYISPETVAGGRVDRRTDLYSLGVVLFELLTKKPYLLRGDAPSMFAECLRGPYRAPSSLRDGIPRALDEITRRALAIDPEERYGSAREMSAALSAAIEVDRALPPAFVEELARARNRVDVVLAEAEEKTPVEAPTEIWAHRTKTMELTRTVAARPPPRVPARVPWAPIAAAAIFAIGLGGTLAAYRASTEEVQLQIDPVEARAPEPKISPRAAIEEETREPAPVPAQPPRAPAPVTKVAPAAIERDAEPDFEALARAIAELKAREPARAAELDHLMIDVTMWRRADPSPKSREAWWRLRARFAELEEGR